MGDDGVSAFERPRQGSRHQCLVPYSFTIPERVPGITVPIAGLQICTSTYTPQFGAGHWSINCAGDTSAVLSEHAKILRDLKQLQVNELFIGGN